MIYPEVSNALGYEYQAEVDQEEDEEKEEFAIEKDIKPLHRGEEEEESGEEHDSWVRNPLEYVAHIATSQMEKASAVASSIAQKLPFRRKSFVVQFNTRRIPFEFSQRQDHVIVTHLSRDFDERVARNTLVLGINDIELPIGEGASEELEKLIELTSIPFTITFAPPPEEHVQVGGAASAVYAEEEEYEEDEPLEDTEEHNDHHPHHAHAPPAPPSLLQSSYFTMTSLTDRVRALVQPSASTAPTPAPSAAVIASPPPTSTQAASSDGSFELVLAHRSTPFVYDLHADGCSIVVVKVVSAHASAQLQEGCVVRQINDEMVYCTARSDFDAMLAKAALPIRLMLEPAPPVYRHQDALSLYTAGAAERHLHMYTVLPNRRSSSKKSSSSLFGPAAEYDDVHTTSRRATQVLQAFRAQGVAVQMMSIETVLVAENRAYTGLLPSGASEAVLRGIRVWFRFSDAMDIQVASPASHLSALEVLRHGTDDNWIVIKCVAASPWLDAGMVLGRPYILTHVNDYDVSSAGYRSVEPRARGDGSWEGSVLPMCSEEYVKFTIV